MREAETTPERTPASRSQTGETGTTSQFRIYLHQSNVGVTRLPPARVLHGLNEVRGEHPGPALLLQKCWGTSMPRPLTELRYGTVTPNAYSELSGFFWDPA